MPAVPDQKRILERLAAAGLRPTRQRIGLSSLLFGSGHRHVTAEHLHGEALACGLRVSLATVYNALHQMTGAGMLREVVVEAGRFYFDTNTSAHHHFFHEESGLLTDVPGRAIHLEALLPPPPPGTRVKLVDVVIRLEKLPDEGQAVLQC